MSCNGGGGTAPLRSSRRDHCEHERRKQKSKAKEDKRFFACARARKILCVHVCASPFGIIASFIIITSSQIKKTPRWKAFPP
jgi:hypothetical protein